MKQRVRECEIVLLRESTMKEVSVLTTLMTPPKDDRSGVMINLRKCVWLLLKLILFIRIRKFIFSFH